MAVDYVNGDREFVDIQIHGLKHRVLYQAFVALLAKDMGGRTEDLLHAAVGICGEAGELMDAVKKHWAYGKDLDRDNIIEELGDLEWYMQLARLVIGVSRAEVLEANQAKLSVRYAGLGYSDDAAIARADKVTKVTDSPREAVRKYMEIDETAQLKADVAAARAADTETAGLAKVGADGRVQAVNYDLGPEGTVGGGA